MEQIKEMIKKATKKAVLIIIGLLTVALVVLANNLQMFG